MLTRGFPLVSCIALSVIFGLVIGVTPAESQEEVFTPPPAFPDRTSTFFNFISCYDVRTSLYLNCGFTHQILGLKEPVMQICTEQAVSLGQCTNGGHQHDFVGHPLGRLEFNSVFFPMTVQGSTNNTVVVVFHDLPEVTGQIRTRTIITPPPRYFCLADCNPTITLDVRVQGLEILPDRLATDNDDYITVRGLRETHPEGHWGMRDTLDALQEIAQEYRSLTGKQLSVNDISLPKGGLFDFHATYAPPHSTHRTGSDADINRAGVNCNVDKELKLAVETIAERRSGVQLTCESEVGMRDPNGPFKHIDFD